MSRIRTIQPHFARSPSMSRVSRDARLLFVLLWTVVDDDGRCHAELEDLAQVLYPSDFDARHCLLDWLGQLEIEGCIERYSVEGEEYLRVVHWHKHQKIYHPTPSQLPASPQESLQGRRDVSGIRESSGKRGGRSRKTSVDQGFGADPQGFPENGFRGDGESDAPVEVTPQRLLHYVDQIRVAAHLDGSYANALRSVALMAQIGLHDGGRKSDRKKKEPEIERSPTLAELHGRTPDGRLLSEIGRDE